MKTLLLWIQTIGWALICLLALIIVLPLSIVMVGIMSRNDDMHIPDPETDDEIKIIEYLNNQSNGGYDKM